MSHACQPADEDVSGCEFPLVLVCEIVFHFEQSSVQHLYAVYDRRLSPPCQQHSSSAVMSKLAMHFVRNCAHIQALQKTIGQQG